jgi:hypothetical protein
MPGKVLCADVTLGPEDKYWSQNMTYEIKEERDLTEVMIRCLEDHSQLRYIERNFMSGYFCYEEKDKDPTFK